jgi:hypothetical protein
MLARTQLYSCLFGIGLNVSALGLATESQALSADLVGIKLGMNPDQARHAIQTMGAGWSFGVTNAANGKIDSISATRQAKSWTAMAELVLVQFNASTGAAWYVGHDIVYEEGQRPLYSALIHGYLQKYGTPSYIVPRPNVPGDKDYEPEILWSDDASGQSLKSTRMHSTRCIGDEGRSVPGDTVGGSFPFGARPLSYPDQVPDNCGFTGYVSITRDANNRDLAHTLAVWIADMHSRYIELAAENSASASKAASDRASAAQKAASLKPRL